jgi:hypothetical protein
MESIMKNIAEQLQTNAGAAPAFSEALHSKIMLRVQHSAAAGPIAHRRPWYLSRVTWSAAASLALIAAILWTHSPTLPTVEKPSTAALHLPQLPDMLTPVNQKLEESRYAYLDRDGQRLANYLLNQLDLSDESNKH